MDKLLDLAKLTYSSQKPGSGDGTFDDEPWMPMTSDSSPYIMANFRAEVLIKKITVRGRACQFLVEYKPKDKPWETEFDEDNQPRVSNSNMQMSRGNDHADKVA